MPPDRHQILVNSIIQNKKRRQRAANIIVQNQGTASGKQIHKL